MTGEPDPDTAAAGLATALQAFADLVDIGHDAREVELTTTGPAGLPIPAGMTARTAAWLAEILRRETAALGPQIAAPEDDPGFDVWGT